MHMSYRKMGKILVFVTISAIFVATTLSFPALEEGADVVVDGQQALIAVSEDGKPELVIVGDGVGRAGLSQISNFLNFTAYLEGRQPNVTQISFVPLITILSSLNG